MDSARSFASFHKLLKTRAVFHPPALSGPFAVSNPLMTQVAQMAEQVRQHRHPVAPDNPLVAWQAQFSDAMVAALAAVQTMLPADPAVRAKAQEVIRRTGTRR